MRQISERRRQPTRFGTGLRLGLTLAIVLAAVVSCASEAGAKAFSLESDDGNFEMRFGGVLNVRYDHGFVEGEGEDVELRLRRARTSLKGHAFSPALKYGFQIEFAGTPKVLDYYLDYKIIDKRLHVRVGQWRTPFSRQMGTSITRIAFNDRSIADDRFGWNRDVGIALHRFYGVTSGVAWYTGFYNGTLTERGTLKPTLMTRVAYNHGGIKVDRESDFERGPLRWSLGVAGLAALDTDEDDQSDLRLTVDAMFKLEGWHLVAAFYLGSAQAGEGWSDRALDGYGAHVQTGYLVTEAVQPLVRYAMVVEDIADAQQHEFTLGARISPWNDGLALVLEAVVTSREEAGVDALDYRGGALLQLRL